MKCTQEPESFPEYIQPDATNERGTYESIQFLGADVRVYAVSKELSDCVDLIFDIWWTPDSISELRRLGGMARFPEIQSQLGFVQMDGEANGQSDGQSDDQTNVQPICLLPHSDLLSPPIDGTVRVTGALFKPLSFKILLSQVQPFFPCNELANPVHLSELWSLQEVDDFLQAMSAEDRDGSVRPQVLSDWLISLRRRVPDQQMSSLRRLREDSVAALSRCRVNTWAERSHVSERQLRRLILEHSGLTPKDYLRVLRLRYSLHALWRNESPDFGGIAEESGFTDRQHWNRECRGMLGFTPKEIYRGLRQLERFPDAFEQMGVSLPGLMTGEEVLS